MGKTVSENLNLSKYKFNDKCNLFLRKIEKDYGYPIRIIRKDLNPSEHGFSRVEDNLPIIEISNKEEELEGLLIHEAYHLRLKYDGMPNIGFRLRHGLDKKNNTYLNWFGHLFWDKVSHHYFYQIIKDNLQINPYEAFKKELEETYRKGVIEGLQDATRQISLAGYLLQTWVETQDLAEVDRLKEFLENQYEGEGVEMGSFLIELFTQSRLETFEDCTDLFQKLFDHIHSSQDIRIVEVIEEEEDHGNYTQHIIFFKIGSIT